MRLFVGVKRSANRSDDVSRFRPLSMCDTFGKVRKKEKKKKNRIFFRFFCFRADEKNRLLLRRRTPVERQSQADVSDSIFLVEYLLILFLK